MSQHQNNLLQIYFITIDLQVTYNCCLPITENTCQMSVLSVFLGTLVRLPPKEEEGEMNPSAAAASDNFGA